MRDMSIYEERDGLLAEVERLRKSLHQWMDSYVKMQQAGHEEMTRADDGEAKIRKQAKVLAERDATIERVRALVPDDFEHPTRIDTHWDVCHRHHRDCLVLKVRAAIEAANTPHVSYREAVQRCGAKSDHLYGDPF